MYGNINLELDNIKEAEIGYYKCLKYDNKEVKAITGLGIVERMRGNYEKSEDMYYKALKIDPEYYKAKSSLLILELLKENYETAIILGENATKHGFNTVEIGVIGNLMIAYHYGGKIDKRDKLFEYLRDQEYADLFYLQLVISGKFELKEIFDKYLKMKEH